MLLFCPSCSNMLTIAKPPTPKPSDDFSPPPPPTNTDQRNRFECRTCPYQYILDKPYFETKRFTHKGAAEILGGAEAMDKYERVDARCKDESDCDGRQAYVYQLQIRSADEPMTTFFTCTKCLKRWQEN